MSDIFLICFRFTYITQTLKNKKAMTTNVKIETQIELKKFSENQLLEILKRMKFFIEELQISLLVEDHSQDEEAFLCKLLKHFREGIILVESEYLSR